MTSQLPRYTILLPVINETSLLEKTFDTLAELKHADYIDRYIVLVCKKTTPESMEMIARYEQKLGDRIQVHHQRLPYIGGAMREGFELSTSSHVVMMASDMETDPAALDDMIPLSISNPEAIITATRWMEQQSFVGYSPLKKVLNYIFQFITRVLYRTSLTDLTFAYRVFPMTLVKRIKWEELQHPFFLETILKPLRLHTKVFEVPSRWVSRNEGESQNTFWKNFDYFRVLIKYRFVGTDHITKDK